MSQSYTVPRIIAAPARADATAPALKAASFTGTEAPRLLCAARYGQLGASSRLRIVQYRPFLERAGLRTTLRTFLSDDYVRALYARRSRLLPIAAAYLRALTAPLAARRHDMLWIEKEFLPWLPYWLERRAIGNTPYILDFDDAWSLRYERAGPIGWLLGQKFRRLLRGAALTVTGNAQLYNWAEREGAPNILLLPTVIDLAHYIPCPEPEGVFTIGWIGTPLTASYLEGVAEPLRRLAAEAPLKLRIIGAPGVSIAGVDCEHAPWSEATEAELIGQCHAGIMPLPDDDWARGKSGYKLIQYMAMGRPAVASAVGANRQIIQDGITGSLANNPAQWYEALSSLRRDGRLRREMGAASRQRVEQQFSLQVTAPLLIENIRKILGSTG